MQLGCLFALAGTTPVIRPPPDGRRSDIRTIQELLDHKDVSTTMVYTPALNRGPGGIRSPLDR
jgi:integrase